MKRFFVFALFTMLLVSHTIHQSIYADSKIVGCMQVRNEENCVEQALRLLKLYVDKLIVLNDGSTDATAQILQALLQEGIVDEILTNQISLWELGSESDNQQKLLEAVRAHGGTHIVWIDADEIISANCLDNNYLRNFILSLKPGESASLKHQNLWRSPYVYRADNSPYALFWRNAIFCDYPGASFSTSALHGSRYPSPLPGKHYRVPEEYVILHFQFVNWKNLLIKQAWYRCLEHVKKIQSVRAINERYRESKNEKGIVVKPIRPEWFAGYQEIELLDVSVYDKPVAWRLEQVRGWFKKYGKKYFKELDIWDVDWKS